MSNSELIEKLKTFPPDANVFIVDWRKNLYYDSGEGSGEGISTEFELTMTRPEDMQDGSDAFIAIGFVNDDYTGDGLKVGD